MENEGNELSDSFFNVFSKEQLSFNNNWLKKSYKISNSWDQRIEINKEYPLNRPKFYEDENSLRSHMNSKNENSEIFDISKIKKFLNQTNSKELFPIKAEDLSKYTDLNNYYEKSNKDFRYLHNNGYGLLKFTLEQIDVDVKEQIIGFLQIYDSKQYKHLSDRVYFRTVNGELQFSQTNKKTVFFQLNANQNVQLLCVLSKKVNASNIPFAISSVPLFDPDSNFLQSKQFPPNFNKIGNETLIDSILQILNNTVTGDVIRVMLTFSTELVYELGKDEKLNYIWCNNEVKNIDNSFLFIPSIPNSSFVTPPIITLSNFKMYFKVPPKCNMISLKIYLLHDPDTEPQQRFIVPYSSNIESLYITLSQPSKFDITFQENLNIFVDQNTIYPNEHIVIQIAGDSEPIAIAYFKIPSKSGQYSATIFEQSTFPPNYLSKNNKLKKITLTMDVKVPENIFLPKQIQNLTNNPSELITSLNLDEIKHQSEDALYDNFIPLLSTIVENINNEETAKKLIELISIIDQKRFIKAVKPWMDYFFEPKDSESTYKFIDIFTNICENYFTMNNKQEMRNISLTFSFVYDLINITLLRRKNASMMNNISKIKPLLMKTIALIVRSLSYISEKNLEDFQENSPLFALNESFSNVLRTILIVSSKQNSYVFSQIFLTYIRALEREKENMIEEEDKLIEMQKQLQKNEKDNKHDKNQKVQQNFTKQNKYLYVTFLILRSYFSILQKNDNFITLSIESIDLNYFNSEKFNKIFISPYSKYLSPLFLEISNQVFTLYSRDSISKENSFSSLGSSSSQPDLLINSSHTSPVRIQQQLSQQQIRPPVTKPPAEINAEILMSISIISLSLISLQGESLSDDDMKRKIAASLLPMLQEIFISYETIIIQKNQILKDKLIPSVLFIINYSPIPLLKQFYETLGSMQISFINFLIQLTKLIVIQVTGKSPTKENPCFEQTILSEFTKRTFYFIYQVRESLNSLDGELVSLIQELNSDYQPLENIDYFFLVSSLVLEKQNQDVRRSLIKYTFTLLCKESCEIKNFAASLFMQSFKADYSETKSIFLSSIEFMDSMTDFMFNYTSKNIINTCMNMLNILIDVSSQLEDRILSNKAKERFEASVVVAQCVIKQKDNADMPPEINCRTLMRIADQYKEIPSMRLKWLRQIVVININAQDYISAFIAQMHIIALECKTMNAKSYSKTKVDVKESFNIITTQPVHRMNERMNTNRLYEDADFAFIPSLKVELEPFTDNLPQSLLADFSEDQIDQDFEHCIELGKQAGLYYLLRVINSLRFRLQYIKRDYSSIYKMFSSVSSDLTNVPIKENHIVSPLSYFLVEWRKDNTSAGTQRFVYTVPVKQELKIISILNGKNRFNGLEANLCTHHSENCRERGVCVIPLKRYKNDKSHDNKFFDYYCNEFYQPLTLSETDENYKIIYVKTKDCIPHYRMSVDVIEYKIISKTIAEIAEEVVKQDIDILNDATNSLSSWIPSSDMFLLNHIESIPKILQTIASQDNHSGDCIRVLNIFHKEAAKKLAEMLIKPFTKILALYSQAVNLLESKEEHKPLVALYQNVVIDMLSKYDLSLDASLFGKYHVRENDPMDEIQF